MIERVAVVGAGTMGNGIAHCIALSGIKVSLIDRNQTLLTLATENIRRNLTRQASKALIEFEQVAQAMDHIQTFTHLEDGVHDAQLVVEAITEQKAVKNQLFQRLSAACSAETIFASNTSSISISELAMACKQPDRVIGMHFMNPVPVMKLVEVVVGDKTSAPVVEKVVSLSQKLGKIPVVVKDAPGFIANRILMPMINEAIAALSEGIGGVQEIDTIMKLGTSFPMGPLELADFIGLDVCESILHIMADGFGATKYQPCHLLSELVKQGKNGYKSGEGFYTYVDGGKTKFPSARFLPPGN